MKILVIGAGAIGGLIGGKLAQSGQSVTLVGRSSFVGAVRKNGLRLQIGSTIHRVENTEPVASLAEALASAAIAKAPFDIAILTVKSYDTGETLQEMAAALDTYAQPLPYIVSLQNGVGNEEAISRIFGGQHTIAGTITAPVEVPEPGLVVVTKPKFVVGLAPWTQSPASLALEELSRSLTGAGVAVTLYADAQGMKWTKLLMNMIGNATSAILAVAPRHTFADSRIANLEIDALREALAVMAGAGIAPVNVDKYPLGSLAFFLRFAPKALLRPVLRGIVGGARGGKMPSLYLDLERGRRQNEVNWLNGAVVDKGRDLGIPTPVNHTLQEIVQQIAEDPAQWPAWQNNPAKLAAAVADGQ